ncbi:MAG: hypothetical protein ACOY3I_05875 [Verrucomicrobiota bacterium]
MSIDYYPIRRIDSSQCESIEPLGSKPKYWAKLPHDLRPWLIKITRPNTGEDWAEKIASEIAILLKIPVAYVDFALYCHSVDGEKRACASPSFVATIRGTELVHGNELLSGHVLGYDRQKWKQNQHTVEHIINAIKATFSQGECENALTTVAGFMFLDALICNTDRHHENWGILRRVFKTGETVCTVAPSFDHSSSLGRELTNEKRCELLSGKRIEKYITKGSGGIYWNEKDKEGDAPLQLIQKTYAKHPSYFKFWIQKLCSIEFSAFVDILQRIPEERMDLTAKDFCLELLKITSSRLKSL